MKIKYFAESIMKKRQKFNLGVRGAAAQIGVSPATVSRVENGNLPDIVTYERICAWLNVSPARYLDRNVGA